MNGMDNINSFYIYNKYIVNYYCIILFSIESNLYVHTLKINNSLFKFKCFIIIILLL